MTLDTEIEELHRLTLEAGLTAMEARKASVKESEYLDTWNSDLINTFRGVNTSLITLNSSIASIGSVTSAATSTLITTQQTVADLQTPIRDASSTLMAAQRATDDLDTLLRLPALTSTIEHTDATMSHLDATTKDVQDAVHKYTHPGVWTRIKGFALDVAHVFNPL